MYTMNTLHDMISQDRAAYRTFAAAACADLDRIVAVYVDSVADGVSVADSVAAMIRDYADSHGVTESAALDRVAEIVASLVNYCAWDGRISRAVAAWAETVPGSLDRDAADRVGVYTDRIHRAYLDQISRAVMEYTPADDPAPVADSGAEHVVYYDYRISGEYVPQRVTVRADSPAAAVAAVKADHAARRAAGEAVRFPYHVRAAGSDADQDRRTVAESAPVSAAVLDTVRRSRRPYFRWHVGGEIPNADYLRGMIDVARRAPAVTFLCFTKRHGLVNLYCDLNGGRSAVPENLVIIFSAWPGLSLVNPYRFPVSAPYAGERPAGWTPCPGNCESCAESGRGCWTMRAGDVVGFKYHGPSADKFTAEFAAWESAPVAGGDDSAPVAGEGSVGA